MDENAHESKDSLEPNVTDESLQAELHSYAAALRAEFEESQQAGTQAHVEAATRDFFKRNVQDAALQIVWLAHNSDSDSIRLKASTFIIKEAFDESTREGDPIRELMRELTKTPAPSQAQLAASEVPELTPAEKLQRHMDKAKRKAIE